MDHSHHISLAFSEVTPARIEGSVVHDAADDAIGTVSHLHGIGARSGIVVDVSSRLVAIPASQINFMRDADGRVHGVLGWTRDQVEAMPEHEHQA